MSATSTRPPVPVAAWPARPRRDHGSPPPWLTLAVVLSGLFMVTLDVFIVNVAIPALQSDLGAGAGAIQWVVAGFSLAVGALVVTAGRLGDLLGRRRTYAVGLAAFTLTSAACGLATSPEALVAARVLQGLSAALLMPQVLVIIQTVFRGRALARAYTAYGLSMGIAAVFGQLIGGALIHADLLGLGWRACFLINVPVGLAALAVLRRALPIVPGSGRARMDLVGVALVTAALLTTMLPLIQGRAQGWPTWTWVSLAASAALFAEFLWYERRLARSGGAPLVDLAVFRERTFSVAVSAQLAFNTGLASFFLVFAIYVQEGRGLTAMHAGELFAAIGVGYLLTSTCSVAIAARLGRHTVTVGALVTALGLVGVQQTLAVVGDRGPVWWLAPALAVDGAGLGIVIAPLSMTALSRVPSELRGAASGILSTVMQLGGALGVALIGVVFYGHLTAPAPAGLREAFGASLYFLVAVELVVAGIAQLLPREKTAGREERR